MNTADNTTPDQAEQIIYSYLRTAYALPDAISKIITGQSGHETAGWTSNVYHNFNNLFGYGYSGGGNYYFYPSLEDSIDDLVGWLDRHIPGYETITDPAVYAQALHDNGYYTDTVAHYAAGVARWVNNNLQLVAGISTAVLVGVGLLIYLLTRK